MTRNRWGLIYVVTACHVRDKVNLTHMSHLLTTARIAPRFLKWNKSERSSTCFCRGFVSTNDCWRVVQRDCYKEAATTKECPFLVDKVTAMLPVLWPFLYRSHPSYLSSLRHSVVIRSSSLQSFSHGLSKQPILRFLVHRFLTLSHSAVLASRRYFRPTPLALR